MQKPIPAPNDFDLPTAAHLKRQEGLPETLKQQVARRAREIGSNYERDVAKKICNHFGISKWQDGFFRTKPHGRAQPDGDIKPINDIRRVWLGAELGPLECKRRKEWSFPQFFKNPEKSHVYGYWIKSNEDTKTDNSIVFFTKPGTPDLVFYRFEKNKNQLTDTVLFIQIEKDTFVIQTLKAFLTQHFPDPLSLL